MKKVISIALALLMVAVMLPVMAMAAEPTEVATQEALKNAVANSGNIKLTSDIVLTETLTINSGVIIVLDLAGKKISAAMNKPHMISSAGNLTIIDSVGTGSIAKEGNSSDYGYVLENHGTMVLNGIKVTSASSKSSAIENGWYTAADNTTSATCKMTITNSDISQTNGSGGLYTIKNDDYGVMVINGGNFTNSTASAGTVLNWNDLTINDGNFTGASAVRTLKQGDLGYEAGKTLIKGGTFNGKIDTLPNYSGMQISVTGGTFNSNVTDYVHASPTVKDENNNYYVGETAEAVLQSATSGTFTVVGADRDEDLNVNPGVTIVNKSGANIKVNGNEVNLNETYTVPGAPIIIYTPDNEPAFLSGANQVVAPGAAATFRIDEEYDRLLAVAVDGVTLDKSNYEAWSGSTYIKLLPKFMKTLSVGTHTLTAYFTSHTVSTTFTISEGAKNPATGANDFVGVAAAMAVISLLGAAAVIRKK